MSKVKIAVIGAGDRGKDRYGAYGHSHKDTVEFVAVAEPNPLKREDFVNQHHISPENVFSSWEELLAVDKLADGIIIATQDDMHFEPTKLALEKGYDVLLEKPMSNDLKETVQLGELAKKFDNTFMICHVLRYTPFFAKIKSLIEEGVIGEVMSVQHNENIAYYHMAHSFVRGNWRNSDESSPIILAKSCHDMDIVLWLVGQRCKKISSFGSLSHFKADNQPEGASDRCLSCGVEETCPYSAKKLYYKRLGTWPTTVVTDIQTEVALTEALENGPYGRCAYKCDNNVCDHQVTIMEFEKGITATFNLSAFTEEQNRTLKIMGTKGEIRGIDTKNQIEVRLFGNEDYTLIEPEVLTGGHNGGDTGIMNDFVSLLKGQEGKALTSADVSVESHVMAFAAEHSRLSGKSVDIKSFYDEMV
ncbi:Gfo/Idh/MocA family oxidoreductase [Acidaminobacter sp. JC074]|uniref:Gfo/Idh/MocA family protein n=1 Tax=Acidaminobacter sp. JC074 TaxID=2530199 RepID=UPI001F0F7920|nr:Gfo/Idh/MocA family oxidoreductase [Acidaminobacter sp. JC074]MCH4888409.1 Gfo/Idh/MocA family oxidoreductase [Acidaminobacter sp. JC074]